MEEIIEIMLSRAGWLIMCAAFLGLGVGYIIWGRMLSAYEQTIEDINIDRSQRTRRAASLEVEITALQSRFDNELALRNSEVTSLEAQLARADTQDTVQLREELAACQTQVFELQNRLQHQTPLQGQDLANWQQAVRDRDAYIARLEEEMRQQWSNNDRRMASA